MKSILTLLILSIFTIQISSCKNNGTENLIPPKFEVYSDTATIIFQNFQNQTLLSEFDTVIVRMLFEENKTTIISKYHSSSNESQIIIHKSGENYSIEYESVSYQCGINSTELAYNNLGNLLIGSCWLESNGMPYSDSGSKAIFSSQYGVILSKVFQTGMGQLIYSIDGEIIPVTQRQDLLTK
jgi:hypothetical protein